MRMNKDMQMWSARKPGFFKKANLLCCALLLGMSAVAPVAAQEQLRQEIIDDETEAILRQNELFDFRKQTIQDQGLPYSDSWKAAHPELSIKLNPNSMVEVIERQSLEAEMERMSQNDFAEEYDFEYGNPFKRRRLQADDTKTDPVPTKPTKDPVPTKPTTDPVVPTTPVKEVTGFPKDLCKDAIDNKCVVKDEVFDLNKDSLLKFENLESLTFQNVNITCKTSAKQYCNLFVKMTLKDKNAQPLFSMLQNTNIKALRVNMVMPKGRLIIDGTSQINVDGTSKSTRGTAAKQGASFIGEGGYSGYNSTKSHLYLPKTYGVFDEEFASNGTGEWRSKEFMLGSRGMNPDIKHYTQGGGIINLELDSYYFLGRGTQISANGYPLWSHKDIKEENIMGGTGGYVYIKTHEIGDKNKFDQYSKIACMGGFGKNNGHGGSGGIMFFDGSNALGLNNVQINGGLGDNGWRTERFGTNAASGTVHWTILDALLIDNGYHRSDKKTRVDVLKGRPHLVNKKFKYNQADNTVAHDLYFRRYANVSMEGSNINEILVPVMSTVGMGWVDFNFKNSEFLILKYHINFNLGYGSMLNFEKIPQYARLENYEKDAQTKYGNVKVGNVKFSKAFKIADYTNELTVQNTMEDVYSDKYERGYIELYSKRIRVYYSSTLKAQAIFLFANETIQMNYNAKIISTLEHECHDATTDKDNKDLYQCMNYDLNEDKPLNFEYIIKNYNDQYHFMKKSNNAHVAGYANDIVQMKDKITKRWNVYLMSLNEIVMDGAHISGPRVSFCSNSITMKRSSVDTNFRGCPNDKGRGNLARANNYCGGAGGAHGGPAGKGGSVTDRDIYSSPCKAAVPKAYWQGREARYEGSGGSSGDARFGWRGSITRKGVNGGSGGGVIWLTATKNIEITTGSSLNADGKWGILESYKTEKGSGGGAGGSIQITTQNLKGDGHITLQGGDGSANGGGGGAGGRFIMNFLRSYAGNSQPNQSYYWTGTIDYTGGRAGDLQERFAQPGAGSNGTLFESKCFPGYSGIFCSPCPAGSFKYDFSYGKCLPCINKPVGSFYYQVAETSSICSYDCEEGSVEYNPECLDMIDEEFEEIGGYELFFIMVVVWCITTIIMYIVMSMRANIVTQYIEDLSKIIYTNWEKTVDNRHINSQRQLDSHYRLYDECMWSHVHRSYLVGCNTIGNPWIIAKDFPTDVLPEADMQRFIAMVDRYNQNYVGWSIAEQITFYVLSIIYYVISKPWHFHIRRQKFFAMQKLFYAEFPDEFWDDKGNNKSLRLGCSDDYTLAYIDFLDFSITKKTWPGFKLPHPILLAGSGTNNSPYKLDFINDAYVKFLVLINYDFLKDKLPAFLENFNSHLAKLSFNKLDPIIMTDLYEVVKWVEKANITMFNHMNVKCVLYLCENQTVEVENGLFKQTCKSFPLESLFFASFPKLYKSLLNYISFRMHGDKSHMRLLLVFKRFSRSKAIGTNLRIDLMQKQSRSSLDKMDAYDTAVQRQESILFDETDSEKIESKVSYVRKIDMDTQEETQNEDRTIKVVDKKFRAFSYTIDACKLFEIAIRKPRLKWKYRISQFKGFLHGVFMLFLNHMGSPTSSKDLKFTMFMYCLICSCDVAMLSNFTFHCFNGHNFEHFGFAFFFLLFGVPYFSPILHILSAFSGSDNFLRMAGNMNTMLVTINYPLTFFFMCIYSDIPEYKILLIIMTAVKICLSYMTAQIRQYLKNPRYGSNEYQLRLIMARQLKKRQVQQKILGDKMVHYLDLENDDNVLTKKMLQGINQSDDLPQSQIMFNRAQMNTLQKKTLEQ